MNILLIVLAVVLLVFAVIGFRRGLLGIVFNLISWIFILVFVMVMNPLIYSFLIEKTSLKTTLDNKVSTYVNREVETRAGNVLSDASISLTKDSADLANVSPEMLSEYGISIPESISQTVLDDIVNTKDKVVVGISSTISTYIIKGISFLIAFLLGKLICFVALKLIKALQEIPILHGICSWLGMTIGLIKGMLLIWLFMYLVSITQMTSFGQFFIAQIESSKVLTFVYQNNLVEYFVNWWL